MARGSIIQTGFSSGVVSPKAMGRVDVARYANGAEILHNVTVTVQGGAERRPASRFIAETKYSNRKAKLIPFVFSRDQAYMLEVGDQYVRFYVANGGRIAKDDAPYEVATPYTVPMLEALDYTQGADTMFMFQEKVLPQVLRRLAEDNWTLQSAPFTSLPFEENGMQPFGALTLASTAVGTDITATAASLFLPADVGRRITFGAGIARITAFTSSSEISVQITSAFPQAVLPAGEWTLEDSPQATLTPSADGEVDEVIDLTFDNSAAPTYGPTKAIVGIDASTTPIKLTVLDHGYDTNDVVVVNGNAPLEYNGTFAVTVLDANTFAIPPLAQGDATALGDVREVITDFASVAGWRVEDVGKFVRLNRGLLKVTEFVSANQVRARVIRKMDSAVGAPADGWSLESDVWNARDGYPRTGCFYEQRLVVAATTKSPQTTWGSRSGLVYDFTLGTEDDDAFSFTLPTTGQVNPIARITAPRALVPLTYGGEYSMMGGVEKPLTPTNVRVTPQTNYGCSLVKPVKVGKELMMVQRAGRKLRAVAYDFQTDGYSAPDLTVLAEHVTKSRIVDLAYQQEPGSLVWCVLGDGTLATLTIDRDEGVVAWTTSSTQGVVESIASIPNSQGDEVWVIVKRVVGGVERRYVERLEAGLFMDSAVTGASADGSTVWSGLAHLEGMTVRARADGIDMGDHLVQNGSIEFDRDAYAVEIGLQLQPRVKLLRPEIQTGTGSSQTSAMSTHKLALLLLDTVGATVNGDPIPFRKFDESLMDNPPDAVTGHASIGLSDWQEGNSPIDIVQTEAYPFHILAVIRDFTANGG
jgi:hypothetical protein